MRRHHLALLALFVALGGTSVAASNALLPRNSVGSAQVVNGSLAKADLNKKTVAALKGLRGAQGVPGPQGPQGSAGARGAQGLQGLRGATGLQGLQGLQGVQGSSGVSGWTYLVGALTLTAPSDGHKEVFCPAGKKPLGGGWSVATGDDPDFTIRESAPSGASPNGWYVMARNTGTSHTITAYVWVICASMA
jgi:hypothetical protein